MRISERIIFALILGATPVAVPALAFDYCAQISPPLSVQPAPSITSKKPVPPASVPESAASSLSALDLYLKNADTSRDDFRYGARWLGMAAQKGRRRRRPCWVQMLFDGDRLPPRRASGLMWLALACNAPARRKAGSRKATTARWPAPPKASARQPCGRCSRSTGSRGSRVNANKSTERLHHPRAIDPKKSHRSCLTL